MPVPPTVTHPFYGWKRSQLVDRRTMTSKAAVKEKCRPDDGFFARRVGQLAIVHAPAGGRAAPAMQSVRPGGAGHFGPRCICRSVKKSSASPVSYLTSFTTTVVLDPFAGVSISV